jgi:hypothetical protein
MLPRRNGSMGDPRANVWPTCRVDDDVLCVEVCQQLGIFGHDTLAGFPCALRRNRIVSDRDLIRRNPSALQCSNGTLKPDIGDTGDVAPGEPCQLHYQPSPHLACADDAHRHRLSTFRALKEAFV